LEDADFTPEKDFMDTTCPIHTKEAHEQEEQEKEEENELNSNDASYTISTVVEGGGSISGPTTAKEGESVTLTFTPNDGYIISNVTIDSVAKGAISSYTFNNITENHTVVVTFVSSGTGDAPPDSNIYEEQGYVPYRRWYETKLSSLYGLVYSSFRHLWLKN
jgi:hypothetical protein